MSSSAGTCYGCGRHAEKRYGGEGRYLPQCIDCWENSAAIEQDEVLYGASFTDVTGKRVDPRTVSVPSERGKA